jgi:hypothetical protein
VPVSPAIKNPIAGPWPEPSLVVSVHPRQQPDDLLVGLRRLLRYLNWRSER